MELNSLGSIDIKWGGGRGGEEGSEKQKINEENLNQLEQILTFYIYISFIFVVVKT